VHQLTHLFEEVRYGDLPAGPAEEQVALNSLTAIVEACGEKFEERTLSGKIIVLAILATILIIALALALTDLVRNVLAGPVTRIFYFLACSSKALPRCSFGMVLLFLLIVAGKSVEEVHRPAPRILWRHCDLINGSGSHFGLPRSIWPCAVTIIRIPA